MKRQAQIQLSGLILIGLFASAIAWYATNWGVWAGSDSAVYLTAARNFISGAGLRVIQPSGKPATLLGPAYSLLLASLGMLKLSLLDAARWINIFLFGSTTFLAGFTFYKFSYSAWLAIPASLLILIFPTMVDLHSGMMTEALYLWASLLGIVLILAYLNYPSRIYIAGAGLFSGLAIITRFIGFALLPVGVVALLALQRVPWKRRWVDAVFYTLLALLPFIAWYIWFQFNPDVSSPLGTPQWTNPIEYLKLFRDSLVNTIWGWVPLHEYLPLGRKILRYTALFTMSLAVVCLPVWGLVRLYGKQIKKWIEDKDARIFSVLAAYCLAYLLGFVFIYLFRTPAQDINDRTLLPLYIPLAGMALAGFSLLARAYPTGAKLSLMQSLPWLVLILAAVAYAPQTSTLVQQYHQNGGGYTNATWRNSEMLKAVEQLPQDVTLISNNTGVIMFYTGRSALEVEELYRSEPLTEFVRYGDNPSSTNEVLFHDRKAALILWEPAFYWQLYDLYQDKTEQRRKVFLDGLDVYGQYADGTIFFYPK